MNKEPAGEPEVIGIGGLNLEEELAKDNDGADTTELENKGKELEAKREPAP